MCFWMVVDENPLINPKATSKIAAQKAKQKQNTINLLWKKSNIGEKKKIYSGTLFIFILQKGEKATNLDNLYKYNNFQK